MGRRRPRKAFEQALGEALAHPGLIFAGYRRIYGAHVGAIEAARAIKELTGKPPRFEK